MYVASHVHLNETKMLEEAKFDSLSLSQSLNTASVVNMQRSSAKH